MKVILMRNCGFARVGREYKHLYKYIVVTLHVESWKIFVHHFFHKFFNIINMYFKCKRDPEPTMVLWSSPMLWFSSYTLNLGSELETTFATASHNIRIQLYHCFLALSKMGYKTIFYRKKKGKQSAIWALHRTILCFFRLISEIVQVRRTSASLSCIDYTARRNNPDNQNLWETSLPTTISRKKEKDTP